VAIYYREVTGNGVMPAASHVVRAPVGISSFARIVNKDSSPGTAKDDTAGCVLGPGLINDAGRISPITRNGTGTRKEQNGAGGI
jgi:hypothetical protein